MTWKPQPLTPRKLANFQDTQKRASELIGLLESATQTYTPDTTELLRLTREAKQELDWLEELLVGRYQGPG